MDWKGQYMRQEQADPMGHAIADYVDGRLQGPLVVQSFQFEDDELPVETLFRSFSEMPPLEQLALEQCRGRVLDVGAGAGAHTLVLQERGFYVEAIDISRLSVETMRRRGVFRARACDYYNKECVTEKYDTVLFLMNGLGIAGSLAGLSRFFSRLDELLSPDGRALADSSDLRYVFEDDEGNFIPEELGHYYGEVDFQMRYGSVVGKRFRWLYVDFETLRRQAVLCGFEARLVAEGEHFDYLCELRRLTGSTVRPIQEHPSFP